MKEVKKFFVAILVISMLLGVTACGCNHLWESATCTQPRHCVRCGKVEGGTVDHNWTEATCTSPKKCSVCDLTEGEKLGHDWLAATYTKPETCSRCKETRGEKLVSVSELGFYNLSEMGNILVSIDGYRVPDSENAYIVANGGMLKFENGYRLSSNFTVENGKAVLGSWGHPENYVIVNNDNVTLDNGWDYISIEERRISDKKKDFVVFITDDGSSMGIEHWYVPYNMIDWERGAEPTSETTHGGYKLYIK